MKLTTDDARALLDELRLLQPPERGEGDIDARQYAEMFSKIDQYRRTRSAHAVGCRWRIDHQYGA